MNLPDWGPRAETLNYLAGISLDKKSRLFFFNNRVLSSFSVSGYTTGNISFLVDVDENPFFEEYENVSWDGSRYFASSSSAYLKSKNLSYAEPQYALISSWESAGEAKIELSSDGVNWCEMVSGVFLEYQNCSQLPSTDYVLRIVLEEGSSISELEFVSPFCSDVDGDGYYSNQLCPRYDCDEADNRTYRGAPEFFDNKDNQCPGDIGYGLVDEGIEPDLSRSACLAGGNNWTYFSNGYDSIQICCGDDPLEGGPFETWEQIFDDGRDNDCDGLIDGQFPVDFTSSCLLDPDGNGTIDESEYLGIVESRGCVVLRIKFLV
jgi:hypothetical protein